jgi:Carboxypeptidase regulatory-like domain/TonB dependent receptor/TonB-dependent Receptor Plug Domain
MTAYRRTWVIVSAAVLLTVALSATLFAQSTTGTIQGTVKDEQGAVVPGATVTIKNVDTNLVRSLVTGSEGEYRFPNLAPGNYELTAELAGFTKYHQSGIRLMLNQDAVAEVVLKPAGLAETVTVEADAPLLNTTNAEVGVRFDERRVAELPVAGARNIYNLALSAPGVSELGAGQSGFAAGANFAVNGMRLRSNNFMLDGVDSNDPSVTGATQQMNNTDIVQEVRLITNQFAAEYGRAAGSVLNVVTKSGTNALHGSAFWFHTGDNLNARTNLDVNAGRPNPAPRDENQWGFTVGGPILKNRTFFFGSYQKWTNEGAGSGTTLNGAPTTEGRAILQAAAGTLPQVQALLKFLPAAQTPLGRTVSFTRNGQTYAVPIGSLTGSAQVKLENYQAMGRVDQQFGSANLGGRYLWTDQLNSGGGQVTPPGLTTVVPTVQHAATGWWTQIFTSTLINEVRFGFQRLDTTTNAFDPSSEEIPSIEIGELGLTGFNADASRTAIGLAVNLPQYRKNNTYQIIDTMSYLRGRHSFKAGVDVRFIDVESFFVPTIRGRLTYPTLQRFIDDSPQDASINKPLPGGQEIQFYDWTDFFFFVQDEWKVSDTFTLNMGLRYETPGNSIASLYPVNDEIVQTAGGDPRYLLTPRPSRDTNNWQPRVGFNWNPRTSGGGLFGFITGGDKMVLRGGYSRTNDYAFININLNIASAFPFVAAINAPGLPNAFTALPSLVFNPAVTNPNTLARTIVAEDFQSPSADQVSLELQREIGRNLVARIGYVGTRGNDLFQTLDGNPKLPFAPTTNDAARVDPNLRTIRNRANAAWSRYHSLQTGLDKRLSGGISAGMHYTWSKFMDTASEIFNPATSGAVAVAQDSFDIENDLAVSIYDRTHRISGNFVWELPFMMAQESVVSKFVGGWQLSANFTFQSGAPFTALNGSDPTGALAGISSLVGDAIRPNLNTDLDLSNMTIPEILAAGGRSLFTTLCGAPSATCPGERVGNVGRNTLRADGIGNIDIGIIKNTRFGGKNVQLRAEMFNATNTRNFGIPEGRVSSTNFLNQWGTNGGSRVIWLSGRFTF